jgi:hypothetical protein
MDRKTYNIERDTGRNKKNDRQRLTERKTDKRTYLKRNGKKKDT